MLKKWLFLFLFLIPLVLFSEEQPTLTPYKPSGLDGPAQAFETKVKHEESKFNGSGSFQRLLIYLVTREDDLSLCKGNEECLELATEDLLPMRYLSEGRCSEIKYEVWGEKEVCRAIKSNSCDALPGWKKDICNGLMQEDAALLHRAGSSAGFKSETGRKMDKGEAESILAIYSGYKHYSILPCERFMRKEPLLPEQLSCEVLFSPFGVAAFDSIVRDIALFNISKDEKDPNVCAVIKNSKIKKYCLDKRIKKLQDIW